MNTIVNNIPALKKSYTLIALAGLLLPACYVETGEPTEPSDELRPDLVNITDPAVVLERDEFEWQREADDDVVSPVADSKTKTSAQEAGDVYVNPTDTGGDFCAADETTCGDLCCTPDETCERRILPLDHRMEFSCVCEGLDCQPVIIDPVEPTIPSPWPGPIDQDVPVVR